MVVDGNFWADHFCKIVLMLLHDNPPDSHRIAEHAKRLAIANRFLRSVSDQSMFGLDA